MAPYIFMADLSRAIDIPSRSTSVSPPMAKAPVLRRVEIKICRFHRGVHVIVVEDILDSGNTLSYLLHVLEARHPASIKLCTLLDKPERRVKPINADYVGFTVPNAFIVGYGLDYLKIPQPALYRRTEAGDLLRLRDLRISSLAIPDSFCLRLRVLSHLSS